MADNVPVTGGSGHTILADELTDGVLGSGKAQFVKIMDGQLDASTKLRVLAEDAAHTSGDTGIMALAVRKDTAAALAGSDGDYAPLEVDANGRLHTLNKPYEPSISVVTGTKSSSGDNELVAAPGASTRIVVCWVVIQNESSTATTLILRDGTTSKIRVLAQNQGDGLTMVFPADARWKLTANTALNLNLSGANSCGYTVGYYTEAT